LRDAGRFIEFRELVQRFAGEVSISLYGAGTSGRKILDFGRNETIFGQITFLKPLNRSFMRVCGRFWPAEPQENGARQAPGIEAQ
jgi:hypothetical protein